MRISFGAFHYLTTTVTEWNISQKSITSFVRFFSPLLLMVLFGWKWWMKITWWIIISTDLIFHFRPGPMYAMCCPRMRWNRTECWNFATQTKIPNIRASVDSPKIVWSNKKKEKERRNIAIIVLFDRTNC